MSGFQLPEPVTYLLYCEGSAERVAMEILLDAGLLRFGSDDVVCDRMTGRPTIQRGKPDNLASQYLQMSYENPIVILYILNSLKEQLKLPRYASDTDVYYFHTRPEIEILTIIREGRYADFMNHAGRDAARYCQKELGLSDIKKEKFLRGYWMGKACGMRFWNTAAYIRRQVRVNCPWPICCVRNECGMWMKTTRLRTDSSGASVSSR